MQLTKSKAPLPLEIEWSLTWKCNLHCAFCSTAYFQANELPYATIVEEIIQCRPLCVTLSGGEPLLHPDINIIIDELVRNKIIVNLTTNGMLLNSHYLTTKSIAQLNWVRLSLHSANSKDAKLIMGNKYSLETVLHNIRQFLEINDRLSLFMLVAKDNCSYEHLSYLIFLAKEVKIRKITVGIVKALGRAKEKQMVNVESMLPTFIRVKAVAEQFKLSFEYPMPSRNKRSCLTSNTSISVWPDGTVRSCCFMQKSIGRVNDERLIDIWKERHRSKFYCTEC